MKLAIVTETFPPEVNGVAMTFGVIARELALRGHEVTITRPERDDLHRHKPDANYKIRTTPGFTIPGYTAIRMGFPADKRLQDAWMAERPDLVHVVTEGPLGASAVSTARKLGIPVTSSFHTNFHSYTRDYGFSMLGKLTLLWLRRVHNRTARTFAPTKELCGELDQFGFKRLSVLSRGVDLRRFSPDRRCHNLRASWGAEADAPVVLHVGRMAPEKNYPLLFEAFERIRKAVPRARFVLAGEGPLQKRLQRDYPWCQFAGFFSREEIGRYYASADVYVHASKTETFGNVLTEAMASGLAVVGFDYAAAKQFVQHEQNGLVVAMDNDEALCAEAVRLCVDCSLRKRLSAQAPLSLANQSWTTVVQRFEQELLSVAYAQEVAA